MAGSQLSSNTFYRDIDVIKTNFEGANKAFPDTYMAAEALRSLFEQMIEKYLSFDARIKWQYASSLLMFGGFQSWMISYIMSSARFHDISLMSLRRAIEYSCYLAKVHNSDERATMWLDKFESLDLRKKFSNELSIPQSYFTEKYAHLRPLLILYDYTSDFGIHGNFEALVSKFKDDETGYKRMFSLQNVDDHVAVSLGVILLSGYRMLRSMSYVLKSQIQKSSEFELQANAITSMIRTARLRSANAEYKGNVPKEVLDSINSDDDSYVQETFKEIIAKHHSQRETA
jgi:hypothetical protein